MANPFYLTTLWKRKRLRILKRDGYCCRECLRYGKRTEATTIHHCHPLLERFDLRLTNWNLISLCKNCHGKMHDRITDKLTVLGEEWRERAERMRKDND